MVLFGSFKQRFSKRKKKSQIEIEDNELEAEPLDHLNVQELPDILVQASSHSSVETQNSTAIPATGPANQQEISLGLTLVLLYFSFWVLFCICVFSRCLSLSSLLLANR